METKPPVAMMKLDMLGIDAFCDCIIDGQSYLRIAADLGIGKASVVNWLAADSDRSARAAAALRASAMTADEMAEMVLLDKDIDPQRGRELAFHYRWRARVRNPRDYGEKLQVDSTHTVMNLSDEQIAARSAKLELELSGARLPALPPPADDGDAP